MGVSPVPDLKAMTLTATIIYVRIYVIVSSTGVLLLKMGLNQVEPPSLEKLPLVLSNYLFGGGFAAYGCGFTMWLYLLGKKDLTHVYPLIVGAGYVHRGSGGGAFSGGELDAAAAPGYCSD